jgi:hypothetical protein
MTTDIPPAGGSKKLIWTGRVISALPILMMLFSGSMKLFKPQNMEKGMHDLGYYPWHILPLGIVEVACAIIYLIPRTSVLGAILVTGYLGGATATHVRVGDPKFVMPVLLGVLAWLGLLLRDRRLRALLPFRT